MEEKNPKKSIFNYEDLPSINDLKNEGEQYINTLERRLRLQETNQEIKNKPPKKVLNIPFADTHRSFGKRLATTDQGDYKSYKDHMQLSFLKNKQLSPGNESKKAVFKINEHQVTSIEEVDFCFVEQDKMKKSSKLNSSSVRSTSQKSSINY